MPTDNNLPDMEPVPNAPGFMRPRRDAMAPIGGAAAFYDKYVTGPAPIAPEVHATPTVARRAESRSFAGPPGSYSRAREVPSRHAAGGEPPLDAAIKVIDEALDTIVLGLPADAAERIAVSLRKAGLL